MAKRTSIQVLKEAFQEAEKEYQFALASGDRNRLLEALKNHRRTFAAFDREFRKQYRAKLGKGKAS